GVHGGMTTGRATPVEPLDRALPIRVHRYRMRQRSGGDGASPGGDGIERELELLEPATLSLVTERRVSRPWGLYGGEPGSSGQNWLLPGGDRSRAERLPPQCTRPPAPRDPPPP